MLYTEQHRELMRSVTKFVQSEIWTAETVQRNHQHGARVECLGRVQQVAAAQAGGERALHQPFHQPSPRRCNFMRLVVPGRPTG